MDTIKLIEKAIETEQEAVAMYQMGAREADDPETRTFFEQLVKWEQEHERILRDRLVTLKMMKGTQGL